jgi:L-threonylcarbamoyladenylate synthase
VAHLLTDRAADAVQALRAGGLVALPTETVYGLGADADNPSAVARIYTVKGRPPGHPLIVHCLDAAAVSEWARAVPPWAARLMEQFWPGPLTLVLARASRAGDNLTGGQDSVGVRVPSHPVMREVLAGFGGAIAAPSANRFGQVSPTTARHVLAELGDRLDPALDRILDGGACPIGVESTIVDATGHAPRLLRPGDVTVEQIELATGLVVTAADGSVRAPGSLASHYAPHARVLVVEPDAATQLLDQLVTDGPGAAVGLIALAGAATAPPGVTCLADPVDEHRYAQDLYAALRQADERGMEIVVAVLPPDRGVGSAIRDRLRRAAAGRPGPESP